MKRLRLPASVLVAAVIIEWILARTLASRDVLASILNGGSLAWLAPLGALLGLRLLVSFVLPPWLLWRAGLALWSRRR